jgi:predicted negative regulator of RcsB-dependent stress response
MGAQMGARPCGWNEFHSANFDVLVRIGANAMGGRSDVSGFGKPYARDQSHHAIRAAFRRKWTLVGTLTFLVVGASGVLYWHFSSQRTERKLTESYLAAQGAFDEEIKAFSKQLEETKDLSKVKDLRPDHSKSTPLFREFAKSHPDHPLGWQAALKVAQESMKSKNYDEAVALLEPILPKTRRFGLMQVKIRETLAGLYAEKGEFPKALAELDTVSKISENPLPEQALLRKAQFTYLSGDKEGAAKLLRELASGKVGDRSIGSEVATEASNWMDMWEVGGQVQK